MATATLPTGFGNGDAVAASLDRSPLALRSPSPSPPRADVDADADAEAGVSPSESSPDEVMGESSSSPPPSFVNDDESGKREGPSCSGEPARDAVKNDGGEGEGSHDDEEGSKATKTDANDGAMIPSPRDVGAADSLLTAAPSAMAKPGGAAAKVGDAVQVVDHPQHDRASTAEGWEVANNSNLSSRPVPHQQLLDHPPQQQQQQRPGGSGDDEQTPPEVRRQKVKGLLQQHLEMQQEQQLQLQLQLLQQQHEQQQQQQQQHAAEQEVNPLFLPLQRQRSNVSNPTPLSSIGENTNMVMSGVTPPTNLAMAIHGPPSSTTFGGRGLLQQHQQNPSSSAASSQSSSHDDLSRGGGGTGDDSSYTNTNTHTQNNSRGGGGKVYSAVFGSMEHGSFGYRHPGGGRLFQSPPQDDGRGRRYHVQPQRAIADGKQENNDLRQQPDESSSTVRRDDEVQRDHGERRTEDERAEGQAGGKVQAHARQPASVLRTSKTGQQHPPITGESSSIIPSDPRALKARDKKVKMQDPPQASAAVATASSSATANAKHGAETFRPSSDAYTPRLKKAPTFKPAPERESVSTHSMGTISRPNFRDALRRVAMIIRRHVSKIERRFTTTDGGGAGGGAGAGAGAGSASSASVQSQPHQPAQTIKSDLFLPSMRDAFHEDRFVTPRYKCTMVRVPGVPCGGFICQKEKIEATYGIPTESEIYDFAHRLFRAVQLSSECSIVCLIYVERLMEVARVPLLGTTWRPVFMAGLLLASKVWQDLSSWNIEFATVYPQYSLEAINRLELLFLRNVKWDLYISGSLYAKYYFALRALCEKQDFRHRYNRMVGGVGQVSPSQALKIQHRTEKVKDDALLQLSRSM